MEKWVNELTDKLFVSCCSFTNSLAVRLFVRLCACPCMYVFVCVCERVHVSKRVNNGWTVMCACSCVWILPCMESKIISWKEEKETRIHTRNTAQHNTTQHNHMHTIRNDGICYIIDVIECVYFWTYIQK